MFPLFNCIILFPSLFIFINLRSTKIMSKFNR